MKFIGNQIYQWISRFRNDVYLEDLATSTEQSYLVVDSEGKITKRTTLNSGSNDITTTGDVNSTNVIITGEIRGPATTVIDPAPVGDNNGVLQIKGDLQVDGTTTTINSTTLTVDDKNIVLSSGSTTSLASDGSGITIDGASATLTYTHSDTSWNFNKPLNVNGNIKIGDGGTGSSLTFNSSDRGTIKVNDSEKIRVTSDGFVGVGTTAPSAVVHAVSVDGNTHSLKLGRGDNSSDPWFFNHAGNDLRIYNPATSGSDILLGVDAGSNVKANSVGIGTSTPDQKLDVQGNIQISNTDAEDGDTIGYLNFHNTTGGASGNHARISAIRDSNSAGQLAFHTKTGGASHERMRINSSGNVGIGTSNPQKKLDIAGGDIRLDNSKGIFFATTDGNIGRVGITGDESSDFIQLKVDNSNSHLLRLNTTGVGIGTASPSEKLDVSGNIQTSGNVIIPSDGFLKTSNNNFNFIELYNGSDASMRFRMGHSSVGRFQFLNSSDTEVFTIDARNERVGIGTTSPNRTLTIDTTSSNAMEIRRSGTRRIMSDASGSNGGWVFTGSGGNKFAVGANGNDFQIIDGDYMGDPNGTERLRILQNGNVGIGQTSPAHKLDVAGYIRSANTGADSNTKYSQFLGRHYTNSEEDVLAISTESTSSNNNIYVGGGFSSRNSATNIIFSTAADNTTTTGTERMRITNDGKVGIGITNPQYLFHVNGAAYFASPVHVGSVTSALVSGSGDLFLNNAKMVIESGGNVGIGISDPVSMLHLKQNTTATGTSVGLTVENDGDGDATVQYLLTGIRRWVTGIDHSDEDRFKIASSADLSSDTVLSLEATGNVGIGTNNPDHKLEVREGDVHFENTASSNTFVDAKGSSANAYFRAFSDSNSVWLYQGGTSSYLSAQSGSTLRINSGTTNLILSDNSSEVMRLSSSNVGIGTTSPQQKLDVNGNIRSNGLIINSTVGASKVTFSNTTNDKYEMISTETKLNAMPFPLDFHDVLSFARNYTITQEISTDGTNFSSMTLEGGVFDMRTDSTVKVIDGSLSTEEQATRYIISNVAYVSSQFLKICFTYSSPAPSVTVTVETCSDGTFTPTPDPDDGSGTITQRHQSTVTSASAKTVYFYLPYHGGNTHMRITLDKGNNTDNKNVNVSSIQLLTRRHGDQGQGPEYNLPIDWDYNRNVTIPGSLTVNGADAIVIPDYILHAGNGNSKFGFPSNDNFKVRLNSSDVFTMSETAMAFTGQITSTNLLVNGGSISNTNGVQLAYSSNYAQMQLNGVTGSFIDFSDSSTDYKGRIIYTNSDNKFRFYTNATEALKIDSSQNATFTGQVSLIDTTGTSQLFLKGTGNDFVNAAIVLESQDDDGHYRGAGVYMNNVVGETEWFAGRPYQDADSYQILRRDNTSGNHNNNTAHSGTTNTDLLLDMDNSGNTTFAGTINSGAITSTGKITGTELEGTSLDINGVANISSALTLESTTDQVLVLKSTDNGAIYHSYYRGNDRHGYVGFGGSGDTFNIANEESAGVIDFRVGGGSSSYIALTLDASQNATFAGDITITGDTINTSNSDDYLEFDDDTTTFNPDTNVTTLASVSGIALATNLNDGGGGNFTISTGSTGTELLRVDTSGNVGIGETNPDNILHITKDQGGAASALKLENKAGANNTGFDIDFQLASSGLSAKIGAVRTNSPGAGDSDIFFSTSTNGTSVTEAMRITHDGKVGIGTNSPNQGLHVVDAGIIVSEFESSNNSSSLVEVSNNAGLDAFFGVYGGDLVLKLDDYTANHFSMDSSGNVTISGNLTVNGTTVTVDTTNLNVQDKNITLNYSTGDSSSTANGAGITIQDAVDSSTDATILWNATADRFDFSHEVNLPDNKAVLFGTDGDAFLKHTGSQLSLTNDTGDIVFTQRTDDGDIQFICDDGDGNTTTYFTIDGGIARNKFHKNLHILDNIAAEFGGNNDLIIKHDAVNTKGKITNYNGNLEIANAFDQGDIVFQSDNGTGGLATYMTIDGSSTIITAHKDIYALDNIKLRAGSDGDLQIYHSGTKGFIQNDTGHLDIRNTATNSDIIFQADDGNGSFTEYFRVDGGSEKTFYSKPILLFDSVALQLGTDTDATLYHSGGEGTLQNFTGNLRIIQSAENSDIQFLADNGAGSTTTYLRIDGGDEIMKAGKNLRFNDNVKGTFGTSDDLQIYHDGSNSFISDTGTGDLYVEASSNFFLRDESNNQVWISAATTGVTLRYQDSVRLSTDSSGVDISGTLDVSGNLTINGGTVILNSNVTATGTMAASSYKISSATILSGSTDVTLGSAGSTGTISLTTHTSTPFKINGDDSITITGSTTFNNTVVMGSQQLKFADNGKVRLGDSNDLELYHDNTDSLITNATGDLKIVNNAEDKSIIFLADDGTNSTTPTQYFRLDGSIGGGTTVHTVFPDLSKIVFGESYDTQIWHDGSNSYIKQQGGGDLIIRQTAANTDIKLECDDGDGNEIPYITLDGDTVRVEVDVEMGVNTPAAYTANANANELVVGSGSGNQGMTIYSGDTSTGSIYFAEDLDEEGAGDDPTGNRHGVFRYSHNNSEFKLKTGGNQEALTVAHDGSTCHSTLTLPSTNPTNANHAARKGYVDTQIQQKPESFILACSDETTDLTASSSVAKVTFRMPYAFNLSAVRASVNTAPVGSAITVNVKKSGTTIFSTALTIDAGTKTSQDAGTAAVIANDSLSDDEEITVFCTAVGSSTAGKGLKVTLIGSQ